MHKAVEKVGGIFLRCSPGFRFIVLGVAFFPEGRDHSAVRVSCSAYRRRGICVVVARDGTLPSRVADGIVIYSVGNDGQDDGGDVALGPLGPGLKKGCVCSGRSRRSSACRC